jgi:hypothetical protein
MKLKKNIPIFFLVLAMLAGCMPVKEIGQSVITVTPVVFLISFGFQYLFFRLWKRKWPELTISWLPNLIFLIALIIFAIIFGNTKPLLLGGLLIVFGLSYLTIYLLVLRIWLFFDHARVFTWASILILFIFLIPAFPMAAGLADQSPFVQYVLIVWFLPGSLPFGASNMSHPGLLPALIFLSLLFEVWFRTRRIGHPGK